MQVIKPKRQPFRFWFAYIRVRLIVAITLFFFDILFHQILDQVIQRAVFLFRDFFDFDQRLFIEPKPELDFMRHTNTPDLILQDGITK